MRKQTMAVHRLLLRSWRKSVASLPALLFAFALLCVQNVSAQDIKTADQLTDYLVQEKISLSQAIAKVQAYTEPKNLGDLNKRRQKVKHLLTLNQVKINSLESFLAYQNRQLQQSQQHLKQVQQQNMTDKSPTNLQEKIARINANQTAMMNSIDLIKQNLNLAHAYQDVLETVLSDFDLWESRHAAEIELHRIGTQETETQKKLSSYYQKALVLQQQRNQNGVVDNLQLDESLLVNAQEINLMQLRLAELNLQRKILKAQFQLAETKDIKTLQQTIATFQTAIKELDSMQRQTSRMMEVLTDERDQSAASLRKSNIQQLLDKVQQRQDDLKRQYQNLQSKKEQYQAELKQRLSSRQTLADYQMEGWVDILHQMMEIPGKFYHYLKSIVLKVRDNYIWLDKVPKTALWFVLLLTCTLVFAIYRLLSHVLQMTKRQRLSGHLLDGLLDLLRRNTILIGAAIVLGVLLYFTHIPMENLHLLIEVFLVWLAFRILIQVARMVLLERISDESGKDVRLYYRLRHLFLFGGWSTGLMVFAHQLPLGLVLQDIFNRLFMLFLMAVALVSWRSRDAIHHLLHPFLKTRKRYVNTAILIMVFLFPLCLAITAGIGLVGYFNVAWSISLFLIQIILVISLFILARGMLFDALELLSEWMIASLQNGWLWIQVFLKPLDKIMRLVLFIAAALILFELIGWHTQAPLLERLMEVSSYKLVNVSGVHITVLSLFEFIILFSIFVWMAKWAREFAYRRIYRNVRDPGIRNSLAVFTQYAVILLGSIFTLRVLGIDMSGMSMIIGGLAVGMGFGLRDFASNIIGGIMLLIERPVREGDLITIGAHEGRVAHIGIRSMRVSSWDNMEVLIPNSETFNKPFTNWTHQDSIVRTVVPVKVSRGDDPVMVQQLILDVLVIIPEILSEPASQVYLKQIDEALIEFEVRYYINVEKHTRFEVRSKVLFAITAQFKAAGIKPPIPPFSVELKQSEHYNSFIHQPATEK
ncbi:MAG: mechanosensitive ion channel [Legionellaceae bacterium]|nr:mechanosensitive ion channel [Legionellaceae bacterium]